MHGNMNAKFDREYFVHLNKYYTPLKSVIAFKNGWNSCWPKSVTLHVTSSRDLLISFLCAAGLYKLLSITTAETSIQFAYT